MENCKIRVENEAESKEAQELFFNLGLTWLDGTKAFIETENQYFYTTNDNRFYSGSFHSKFYEDTSGKKITLPQLRDMVVLHRNDVSDATHVGVNNKYYLGVHTRHVWSFDRWVITDQDFSELTPITKNQPDAVASPNNIARTAEDHREFNLSNELNDLCAEFGCLPGADRMQWLRDRLRGTRKPETLYHYSASINTARGTVTYDGVIAFRGRITGIEDYQQARAEIAKDGNVAPEQVNVHSLSIVG